MPIGSKIFAGYRALGFVSDHIPLAVRYNQKHKENYVITSVGNAFHTYNCSRLGIVSVSNSINEEINALAVNSNLVFVSSGQDVLAFEKGKQVVHKYQHDSPVHLLLPFGKHIIAVDDKNIVSIWDVSAEELYLEMSFDKKTFTVSAVMHPSTYLNKILFASQQGSMQLWNVNTNKLLYTFHGWGSAVTIVQQSPAVDVVAIGLADGRIVMHNLRYDETLMTLKQDWGAVTNISFRTDGHPIMATGSTLGHIALWNLDKKRLHTQLMQAHSSSVSGMQFLPSEPLLITSSADNSLKVWIFDGSDGGGRLLHERSGHSAPPSKIRFHGNDGKNILSAGQDSTLRSFSTVHESHNKSLGRASYNKAKSKKVGLKYDQYMMPAIDHFASEPSRESDWDNIVACHHGDNRVTTWTYQRSCMGKHKLQHERFTQEKSLLNATAQVVDISSCGNFALIGYSSGHVDLYNMQSGLYRGSYGKPLAHDGAVRGVTFDGLNQLVITAGADSSVKFWKFKSRECVSTVALQCQMAAFSLHRESGMLAVALDDFTVIVIDIETQRVVRKFRGHTNRITDMTFSPDAKWLITTSMDSSVRTWDVPAGTLLDCFLFDSPATSVALSPRGDFLVSTHIGDLGVYLWSNMTLYKHVSLHPLPADFEPSILSLPNSSRKATVMSDEDEEDDDYENTEFKSPAQISNELVTLSLLPNSCWQNLMNIDVIKKRNKPKQPPVKPKAAPFFLPTIPGLEPKFAPIEDDTQDKDKLSKVSTGMHLSLSEFGNLLNRSSDNYDDVVNSLKQMGPSAIDLEIRSLGPDLGGSEDLLLSFMKMIHAMLLSNRDFELAQAYLATFLKIHGDVVSENAELLELVSSLSESQVKAWNNVQHMFTQSLCVVSYLKTAVL